MAPAKKSTSRSRSKTSTKKTQKKSSPAAAASKQPKPAARSKSKRAKSTTAPATAKKTRTKTSSRAAAAEAVEAAPPAPPAHTPAAPAKPTLDQLIQLGRDVMGIKDLRPGQAEGFTHLLAGADVLAVMPTGSGKSLLYQLTSLVRPGITAVVSPLIALIKDQIDKMEALGVAVVRIDSTLTVRQRREMDALTKAPGGKLLLTTPERMADPEFRAFLRDAAGNVGVSMFVVDEAHCVSQWGHDFRPSYLSLRKAIEDLGHPQVLATTATAPPHVRDDILHQLGIPDAKLVTTTFDRPNLHYECIAVPGDDDKNKTLITLLKKLPRPGIIYCATVKKVEDLYESLARHGLPVAKYHGRLTKKIRDEQQMMFMAPKSDLLMVATNAFGLGVDKADIRCVYHYHVPGSLEAYAQEAGRGGRDAKPARCVLFFSPDDVAIQEYFLKGTYPTRRQVRAVYATMEAWTDHDETPPTIPNLALSSHVGVARTRTVLSLLKDEGFVVEAEGGLFSIADPPPDPALLAEKAKQYEARRIADRQRLDALLEYVRTPGCRSQVILSYLGETDPPRCGRCDNDLRSKEAALKAAQEADRLEDGVVRQLREQDADDGVPEKKRVIRARVIRIDEPPAAQATAETASAAEPAAADYARTWSERAEPAAGLEPGSAGEQADDEDDDELSAGLAADEADDDDDGDGDYGDEEGEYDEDDDEDDEDDDDEDDEDDDEADWVIDKTAAALAEEGVELGDAEITILARKRVPKPPRKKKTVEEVDADKPRRRRRRRRRKKSLIPPKSAFTSPVLVKPDAPAPAQPVRGNRAPAAGPLVEYVRGPMRINMTPVASATPNDVSPNARKKRRGRRPMGPGGGPGWGQPGSRQMSPSGARPDRPNRPDAPRGNGPTQPFAGRPGEAPRPAAGGGAPAPGSFAQGNGSPGAGFAGEDGMRKRRRRRRRRKKRGGNQPGVPHDGPVTFFSVDWPRSGGGGGGGGNGPGGGGSPNGGGGPPGSGGRRRRRRRRRRRGPESPVGDPSPEQG